MEKERLLMRTLSAGEYPSEPAMMMYLVFELFPYQLSCDDSTSPGRNSVLAGHPTTSE
jgi:hypothetical protein